jgi:hypothetical protein
MGFTTLEYATPTKNPALDANDQVFDIPLSMNEKDPQDARAAHPSLVIPNGAAVNGGLVQADGTGQTVNNALIIPAVWRFGGPIICCFLENIHGSNTSGPCP